MPEGRNNWMCARCGYSMNREGLGISDCFKCGNPKVRRVRKTEA